MGLFSKARQAAEAVLDRYIGDTGASQKLMKSMPLGLDEYKRKTIYWDENEVVADTGFKERYTGITFEALARMSMRDSIIALIINKIIHNVMNFGHASPSKFEAGFKFMLRDPQAEMSANDLKLSHLLEEWVQTCGSNENRPKDEYMDFETFLRVETRDRLVYAQTGVELIRDRMGRVHHFFPSPGGSLRYLSANFRIHADTATGPVWGPDGRRMSGDPHTGNSLIDPNLFNVAKYCQVNNQRIIQLFTDSELVFTQAAPINDIQMRGYSFGELEFLVNTVSSHIFTETHNRLFFTNGMSQNGVLFIKGDVPTQEMEAFRRAWHAITAGARNAARLPIISGVQDVNWVNMSVSNKDMEWKVWNDYLIKLMCFQGDTPILTSTGFREIQDIVPGDTVVSHTGKEQKVLNTQKKIFSGEMYSIHGMGFKKIEVTDEHPFLVASLGESHKFAQDFLRGKQPIFSWKKACELKVGDRLVLPKPEEFTLGETWIDMSLHLQGLDIDYDEEHIWIKHGRFEIPRWLDASGEFGEILGWYVAEGSSLPNYCTFALSESDEVRWKAVSKIVNFFTKIGLQAKTAKDGKVIKIQVNSKIFSQFFANLCGKNSGEKKIPAISWTRESAIQFITGYARGDGYCNRHTISIGSVSKQSVYGVKWLLLKLGIHGSVSKQDAKTREMRNHQDYWKIAFCGRKAKEIFENFGLDTAFKNNYLSDDKYFYFPIRSITKKTQTLDVFNFEVENDNSYVAESVAVHNCAAFMMNPTEINFDIVSDKGAGGMGSKEKMGKIEMQNRLSKMESLKPILRYFEKIINNEIIPQAFPDNDGYISKRFKFKFVGLDYDKDKELERLEKETTVFKTLNEARKELGYKPLNIPGANEFIRDPNFMNLWSQFSPEAIQITAQAATQGQTVGGPSAPGGTPNNSPAVNTQIKDLIPIHGNGGAKMKDSVVETKKSFLTIEYLK